MSSGKSGKSPKTSLAHLAVSNSNAQKLQQKEPKTLVSPVLREVGKLAAGVASVQTSDLKLSGSATGNPRNKHALQPGHSLMDWIRLGSSGKDLTGLGSRAGTLSVTREELARHDKPEDAWMAVHGKVFNVTAYIPFHPGGPDELIRNAGTDATSEFDRIHPWVNYNSILQKCLVGHPVAIDPSIDKESLFYGTPVSPISNLKEPSTPEPKQPKSPKPIPSVTVDDSAATQLVKSSDERIISDSSECSDVKDDGDDSEDATKSSDLPRFDWIQKMNFITIIFYTKPFSNPLIEICPPNFDGIVNIRLSYDGYVFVNDFTPERSIECSTGLVKVTWETGKVEMVFKKLESQIWNNFGVLRQSKKTESMNGSRHVHKLVKKIAMNHNTFLLELVRTDDCALVVPIGKHVKVFANINDDALSRSYTPVPQMITTSGLKPFTGFLEPTNTICLLVKRYSLGNLSRCLCDSSLADSFTLSKPLGSFDLARLERVESFVFLAAGTGLTPMLQLIVFLLEKRIRKSQLVTLLFFNKTEKDILLRDQFDLLQNEDNRFKLVNILSDPEPSWTGSRGHVTKDLISRTIQEQVHDTGYTPKDIFFCICGPTGFNSLARDLLLQLDISDDQFHIFAG